MREAPNTLNELRRINLELKIVTPSSNFKEICRFLNTFFEVLRNACICFPDKETKKWKIKISEI